MAMQSAKGKPGARAESGKATGRHPGSAAKGAQDQEKGICIICGEESIGTPAAPELPISAARKLRSLLRLPPRHTVVCNEHLEEAREKRAKFEKKLRNYIIGAVLFFLLIVIGSLAFGRSDLGIVAPALIGALAVALLPGFYYFPSFGK